MNFLKNLISTITLLTLLVSNISAAECGSDFEANAAARKAFSEGGPGAEFYLLFSRIVDGTYDQGIEYFTHIYEGLVGILNCPDEKTTENFQIAETQKLPKAQVPITRSALNRLLQTLKYLYESAIQILES